ncbi:ATP-binding protein [uncultured Roseobacter sp.]|uniref:ATP-binding protein n=1 Tax=uncultured Roseobacter sp. TaxID=114847 RepID=UPI00262D35A0|nr:ATP-binding protein [uncultured Roseobacter sp.]
MNFSGGPDPHTLETERAGLVEDGKVLARRIYAVSRLTPIMMLANIANALSLLLILWFEKQTRVDAIFWAVVVMMVSGWVMFRQFMRRRKPFPKTLSSRTYKRSVIHAAFLGALWAYPGLIILPEADGLLQSFLIALAAGMISGGAITLYPLPAAAYTFCGIVLVGSFVGFSRTAEMPTFWAFALVSVTFLIIISQSIKRHERVFVSEFEARTILNTQNERMAELLDAARRDALEERKRNEDRLLQTQKLEAVGQLTAGIAHDFNNLLTAIRGHAELLEISGAADKELIGPIVQSSDRGAELVRRLLAFARQQALAPMPLFPSEIIRETAALMRRTLREDIQVELNLSEETWPILMDPGLLSNALLNLGTNARDAMREGGQITIKLENAFGELAPSQLTGDYVRLSVQDTGSGMSAETQRRAIEPFYTTKEFGAGSGLGLSMVYGFAVQSGGTMSIESAPGQGTTVTLFLPRSAIVPEDDDSGSSDDLPLGKGKTVLLVEDNLSVRDSVTRLLESLDYAVTATESVEEAKDVLRQSSDAPQMILSDVVLPGGQRGTDFVREVRDSHPQIAMVLMSGYADTGEPEESDTLGGVLFLGKPFTRAALASTMAKAGIAIVD